MRSEMKSYHVKWLDEPEEHDYAAALQFLSLIDDPSKGRNQQEVNTLRHAPDSAYYAKDILRASQLPLLPVDNTHVVKDLDKIKDGDALSPVLLIRGLRGHHYLEPLIIADGYHRVCAAYYTDENTPIRCRIV